MPLLFKYVLLQMRSPAIALAGRPTRPKPLIPISVLGPTSTRLLRAVLDTAADDTVFPDSLAALLGVDLTNAPEAEASGVGGTIVAQTSLRSGQTATGCRRRIARVAGDGRLHRGALHFRCLASPA